MAQKLSREARLRRQRRLVRVPVDIEVLALTLLQPKEHYRLKMADEVPNDAVFITAYYDPACHDAFFVFGHELFDKVPDGQWSPVKDCKLELVSAPGDTYDGLD